MVAGLNVLSGNANPNVMSGLKGLSGNQSTNFTVDKNSGITQNQILQGLSNGGASVLSNGGGYTQPQAPQVDPYAQWGGKAAYDNKVSGFDTQKRGIFDTANDAAKRTGTDLRMSILDLVDSIRGGQSAVDNRGINNELSKQRGTADVYGGVSRGIQSGGVTLANRNASDSSAAEAIARAYGDIGQHQLSDIGNQYELENQDIGLAQADLARQQAAGVRRIEGTQDQAVNSIVSDAQNQLAALDAAIVDASLPDRIAIDAEKNKIRSKVLAELSQYDKLLTSKLGGISALDQNARIAQATERAQLGQAPANAFQYGTTAPAQFQNTGPFASQLPIFTRQPNRDEQ